MACASLGNLRTSIFVFILNSILLDSLPYPIIVWTSCFCSTSIVGLLRSCPNCDYDVCLTCCQEIRNNQPLQNVAEFGKCGKADQYWHVLMGNNIATFSKPVIKNNEIMCPKRDCDNSVLELMHTSENDWISTLEERANSIFETINPTYIEPQQLDDNNDLYWPVSKDVLEKDDLTRFRQHWKKGQPVIFRDVLKHSTGLSWEPMVTLRGCENYLKSVNCYARCPYVINCLIF